MAISVKAPYQAYFVSSEAELKASCIKTGTLDRVYLDTELVDATIDGEQHYSIPAIIHTDYGCRAKKNEEIASAGAELFERATTIIPFRYEAEYKVWTGTAWSTTTYEAVQPKATFVVTIDEDGNDRVLAYIQPQVYFTDNPTWFNHLAPPSLRIFYYVETHQNNYLNVSSTKYHLIDFFTGEAAIIPNSTYTGTIEATNLSALTDIAYYLDNARQYILSTQSASSTETGYQAINYGSHANATHDYYAVQGECYTLGGSLVSLGWGTILTAGGDASAVCYDGESSCSERTIGTYSAFGYSGYVNGGTQYHPERVYYWGTSRTDSINSNYSVSHTESGNPITYTTNEIWQVGVNGDFYEYSRTATDSATGWVHAVTLTSKTYLFMDYDGLLYAGDAEESMFQLFDYAYNNTDTEVAYQYRMFTTSHTDATKPPHLIALKEGAESIAQAFIDTQPTSFSSFQHLVNFEVVDIAVIFVPYNIKEAGL